MIIGTDNPNHCNRMPRSVWEGLQQPEPGRTLLDIYPAACVKDFVLFLVGRWE